MLREIAYRASIDKIQLSLKDQQNQENETRRLPIKVKIWHQINYKQSPK